MQDTAIGQRKMRALEDPDQVPVWVLFYAIGAMVAVGGLLGLIVAVA